MVRVAQGKLQLGVVVGLDGPSLLVAVVVPSRIAPGTTVDRGQVKCAHAAAPEGGGGRDVASSAACMAGVCSIKDPIKHRGRLP